MQHAVPLSGIPQGLRGTAIRQENQNPSVTQWKKGKQIVCFLIPIGLLPLAILKFWHLWLEAQGPSTSLLDGKKSHVRGWLGVFEEELCLASFFSMGVKVASPHSTSRTPVYEASLLEMHRTCFALHLSFWSTDIMEVGPGSRAAHHEPVTYPACVPTTPSGQSQTACGFGHLDAPR